MNVELRSRQAAAGIHAAVAQVEPRVLPTRRFLTRRTLLAIILAISTPPAGVALVNAVRDDDPRTNQRIVDGERTEEEQEADDRVPPGERSSEDGLAPGRAPQTDEQPGAASEVRTSREVASFGLTGRLAFTAMDEPVDHGEYICTDAPCPYRSPGEIRTMDLRTGRASPLTSSPLFEQGASWSPDGSRLAYSVARGDGTASLNTIGADGSDDRMIVFDPDKTAHRPTWSPDGRRIAFVLEPTLFELAANGDQEIWMVNADGTDLHRVIGVDCGFAPSPAGSSRCPSEGASATSPAWSPDGGYLAFAEVWEDVDGAKLDSNRYPRPRVNVLDLETGLVEWFASGSQPAWAPDGKRLTVTVGCAPTAWNNANCEGPGRLEVVEWPSGKVIGSISRPDRRFGEPAWSPDGRWIAFAAAAAGPPANFSGEPSSWDGYARRSICVVQPNGKNLNVVITGSQDYWAPSWAR